MMKVNVQLLKAIRERGQSRDAFGYGITTADRYVKTVQECVGIDACNKYAATKSHSFHDLLTKAKDTLVYSNDQMVTEFKQDVTNGLVWTRQATDEPAVTLPKNTLLAFKHVLTTPKKDRDGDVLRTEGAVIDPKMLLLWQHVHTLPIGKMVVVAEHDSQKLSMISAIVDMNELCHDAAVMIDNGMGRFSHGFRALEFSELKEQEGETTSPGGFDIKRFEIMEASLVSVPSNTDAEVEEVLLDLAEGGRLTSGLMKRVGKEIRNRRNVSVPVDIDVRVKVNGSEVNDENKSGNRSKPSTVEGKGSGCSCGTSKETDDKTQTKETTTADAEVKRVSELSGSWEWIEKELRNKAAAFLAAHGIGLTDRFVWLAGTFADHSVICAEHHRCDVPDEFLYYRGDWSLNDEGSPMWMNAPQRVTIETSVEVAERSPLYEAKANGLDLSLALDAVNDPDPMPIEAIITDLEKAGRTLSRANVRVLQDVKSDLEELKEADYMTRSGGALCTRCIAALDGVLKSATSEDEETSTEPDVKELTASLLAKASIESLASLRENIDAIVLGNQRSSLADTLFGK